ncbi:hypothetical protein Cch01nite_13310 [Cellulomonas chitinilytica]|uniref:Uncharacterized protein n=1 Tax=Cellulomonas chitinilytica TaxID=398759 RepID=A0A919NZT7_9CELL|nr:hypothetical protein [Cellulomonas chitinilytica]GIG20607.1 hypothetical protein Cch01nite_13310 [Cellulomonas chitinilytica]
MIVTSATTDDDRPTPVLFHVHGIGPHDFSSMTPDALAGVDALAAERGVEVVPTVFLRREYVDTFEDVVAAWSAGRARGELDHVLGFGVEGPMLGTSGGVPPAGCWMPDTQTWRRIAALGDHGLRYVVIAPDAVDLDGLVGEDLTFAALIELFYAHGVRLALGHFRHGDPWTSARRTQDVIDFVERLTDGQQDALVTDHLFNDMPRAFRHAWRTGAERERRADELGAFLAQEWTAATLDRVLGPVPAVIVTAARAGRILPMLNFDGDHVDLEICRRTVEYVGADRLIAITDHIEVFEMAGEHLVAAETSSLRLRSDGRVAAGSTNIDGQARNMRSLGLREGQIDHLLRWSPRAALVPLVPSRLTSPVAVGAS